MKRVALALLLTIMVTHAIDLQLNLKAGLNIATLYGVSMDSLIDNGYDRTPTPGLCGGIGLDIGLTNHLSIEPELLLTMKGTEFTKEKDGVTDQFDVEYIYLSMPILLKKNFKLSKIGLHILVGPAPSINLTSNYETSLEGTGDPSKEYDVTYDTKDITTDTDISLVAGFGLEIPLGPGNLTIDARNSIGFRDTRLYHDIWGSHSVFTLMAGYGFELGKK